MNFKDLSASFLAPRPLPLPTSLLPSFQIPATQARIMEDIEQWLSTDVVSWGSLLAYLAGIHMSCRGAW